MSIVIPVYNEAEAFPVFFEELRAVTDGLDYETEIIPVNDGSTDGTEDLLDSLAKTCPEVHPVHLSRNFGHQAALCAGMEAAQGDYMISMDGDGQHPASLIPQMLELAESGYNIVLTQRMESDRDRSFKRMTSEAFYKCINKISDTRTLPGGADFRLMDRQSLDTLLSMPEYHRFLRGMVSWIGFKSVILPFEVPERIAGTSKYTLKKMLRLASDAIFSFSMAPLYIGLSGGAVFLVLALIEAIYVLSFWIRGDSASLAPGWSSLMFMLLIIGALLMVILGFIGVYVGYIFQEVKHRPVYIVKNRPVDES